MKQPCKNLHNTFMIQLDDHQTDQINQGVNKVGAHVKS